MDVNGISCYGLVDSGASISICSKEILGSKYHLDTSNLTNVRGVSGNYLNVLGTTEVHCKIGDISFTFNVTVVEEMADSVFIIGRDILEPHKCIINYRDLTLQIGKNRFPLLKAYHGKRLKKPISVHYSNNHKIPPFSASIVTCHLRHKRRKNKKLVLTTSGVLEPNHNLSQENCIPNGMLNTDRGSTHIQIYNNSSEPFHIDKNKKVGSLVTFHASELNTLNDNKYEMSCNKVTKQSPICLNVEDDITKIVNKITSVCNDAIYVGGTEPTDKNAVNLVDNQPAALSEKKFVRWKNVTQLHDVLGIDKLDTLSASEIAKVKNLIAEFRDIFAENDDDMATTDLAEQKIVLKDKSPVRCKYYNVPLALKDKAEQEVKRLMDLRIIEPSSSTWHSPSFVMLKPDGSIRLLTDFRELNSKIQRTYAPVPALQDLVALWKGCTLYTTLDFQKGFFQTPLAEKSRKYTATSLPGIAFFQYLKSPMGLSSSPGFFQSVVEKLLMGLKQSRCVAFLDDILSGSQDFVQHLNALRAIFERIKESKMLLKAEKCKLFRESLKYLGHILSEQGIATCPEKIESIKNMAPPKNAKGVKSFLGLSGFYRRFIKDYAKIVEPLTRMTKKDVTFNWNKEAEQAWATIKEKLISDPILAHPDLTKGYHLIFDASSYAIGGILCQKGEDGQLHPVSYGSSILSESQRKWSTVQKKLYSLVYFSEKFENYLINNKFHAITDNKALLHLDTFKNAKNDRLWRWFEILQKFEFTISYSPSKQNPSDALSRLPKTNDKLIDTLPQCAETNRHNPHRNIAAISKVDTLAAQGCEPSVKDDSEKPENISKFPVVKYANDTIEKAQESDPTLKIVKSWVACGSKPSTSSGLDPNLKTYYRSFDRLKIDENVLVRSWEQNTSENPTWLACIPDSMQEELIGNCHDPPESGHLGAQKTLQRIRTAFYFPKMDLKTKLHVAACHACIKKRRSYKKLKAPITPFTGTYPGEIVFMDLMEALPVVNGYKSILIIIDSFTKWTECIPLQSTQAEYVARAILNTWISRQGVMDRLHTDKGANVDSAVILKALYKMLGISKSANFAYRPQTDGMAERIYIYKREPGPRST